MLETKPCGVGDEAVALRWRSALEGAGASRETYASPGLRGERAFALFGLAGCHRRACGRAMREGGRGVGGDERENRRGRVRDLANEALPPLRPMLETFRANELTVSMSEVMRSVSLGDAQGLAARRAREKNSGWNLVARLHAAARNFYRDADAKIQSSRCDWNGVDVMLLANVLLGKSSHEAEAYLALAEAFRERDECGQAVARVRSGGSGVGRMRASVERTPGVGRLPSRDRRASSRDGDEDVERERRRLFPKVPPTGAPLRTRRRRHTAARTNRKNRPNIHSSSGSRLAHAPT